MKQSQQQLKQVKIDLEKDTISPPKLLVDAYEKESATEYWTDREIRPEYRNNARIQAASRGSGNKIVKKIFTLYRKRLSNGTEWLIFHISLATKDRWNNTLSMPLLLGFVDVPQFSRTYAFDPHTKSTTGGPEDMNPTASAPMIENYETVYTYPWEQVKEQILTWRKDGTIADSAKFLVWTDKKYSVPSFENWFNLSVDDNVMLNMAGNRFDALYDKGDPVSLEKVKDIIRSELQKGVLSPQK
jgi:hypothetical protein